MACQIPVNNLADVIRSMGLVDILHSLIAKQVHDEYHTERERALHPNDDYYIAPYALISRLRSVDKVKSLKYYMIFAGYKVRGAHHKAQIAMVSYLGPQAGHSGWNAMRLGDSIHGFIPKRKSPGEKIYKFREYAWANGDDVNLELENKVMEISAAIFGEAIPDAWRASRDAFVSKHAVFPVYALKAAAEIAAEIDEIEPVPIWAGGDGITGSLLEVVGSSKRKAGSEEDEKEEEKDDKPCKRMAGSEEAKDEAKDE